MPNRLQPTQPPCSDYAAEAGPLANQIVEVTVKDLYLLLLSGREQDSQRYWVIFSVMNVINGGLFGFAVSTITPEPLKIIASLVGIGLCVLWILGVLRMAAWVRWWEQKLESFESPYFSEIGSNSPETTKFLKDFEVFRKRKNVVTTGCSTRSLGVWIASIFMAGWILLLLFTTIPLVYKLAIFLKEICRPG